MASRKVGSEQRFFPDAKPMTVAFLSVGAHGLPMVEGNVRIARLRFSLNALPAP